MPSEVAVDQPLKVEKVTVYGTDEVTYISDDVCFSHIHTSLPMSIY